MAGREDEAVAVGPDRVGRIVIQPLLPEAVGHGRQAHRRAGMAGLRLLDRVDRKRADGVDAELVHLAGGHAYSPFFRRQAFRRGGCEACMSAQRRLCRGLRLAMSRRHGLCGLRGCSSSAMSSVQPVWCEAPSPAPVSPWKYSLNSRWSPKAGSARVGTCRLRQGRRLRVRPAAPAVFLHQLTVRELRLRILVEHPHVAVRGRRPRNTRAP